MTRTAELIYEVWPEAGPLPEEMEPRALGSTGPTGPTGPGGRTGGPGHSGPTGRPGRSGSPGRTGSLGRTGRSGSFGRTGPIGPVGRTGFYGPPGKTGRTGRTGPKLAILKLGRKWRGLTCAEAPMAWFFDVATIRIPDGDDAVQAAIDPLFVEACEPGTIRVLTTQADTPLSGSVGAHVNAHNQVMIRCPPGLIRPLSVTIMLAGIRRGQTERFPVFTEEQARRNNAFWAQATGAPAMAAAGK